MNDEAAQHTETSRQAPLLPPSEFSKDKFEVSFQPITPPQDTAEQAEARRLHNDEHPEHAKLLKPSGTQELFVEERRKTQVAILDQLIAQAFSTALPAGQELKQGCRYVTRDGRITPPLLWWTKEHPLNGPPMFVARFTDRPVPYYRDGRCVMPADRAGSDLVAEAEQASCLAQEETWVVRMNREIEARYGPGSLAAGPEETSDEGQLAEENQQTEQNETMQNETMSEYQSVALEVLMPISSNAEVKFPVSARNLHQFMEIGKDFSNWIKSRIEQFKLVEGKYFEKVEDLSSPKLESSKSRPQVVIEYWLTLEMAK